MDECPTCGQNVSNQIAERLGSKAIEVRKIFMDRRINLTNREAQVLGMLRGRNRPVAKSAIMDALYGDDPDGGAQTKTLEVFVYKIRAKIDQAGLKWSIVTYPGLGYELREEEHPRIAARVALALFLLLPLGQVIAAKIP